MTNFIHLYNPLWGQEFNRIYQVLKNKWLFRDALLQDKDLMMQYAAFKERLTGHNGISREA